MRASMSFRSFQILLFVQEELWTAVEAEVLDATGEIDIACENTEASVILSPSFQQPFPQRKYFYYYTFDVYNILFVVGYNSQFVCFQMFAHFQ